MSHLQDAASSRPRSWCASSSFLAAPFPPSRFIHPSATPSDLISTPSQRTHTLSLPSHHTPTHPLIPPTRLHHSFSLPSHLVSSPSHCALTHPLIPPTYPITAHHTHALHHTAPYHAHRWVQTDWDPSLSHDQGCVNWNDCTGGCKATLTEASVS